ncbi:MAG TPA: copper homeostasis protein CutC [Prolixibacteraceae bacterium]|nr:copper homeostasis protein CutC [Prolixibacteraceae bacterium]
MNPTPPSLIFEACVGTLEDALRAEHYGAHRIELCSALELDGLTPSRETIIQCVQQCSLPVMVMIRPREGSFVYSESEIRQMESDIEFCKKTGVFGVVFGLLSETGTIDLENTRRLATLASPLEVTFHKAIDDTVDIIHAFKELNSIKGITRVLSSGGHPTAWDGRELLKRMQQMPKHKITLIAAGKITAQNRLRIAEFTGITDLHGKRIV